MSSGKGASGKVTYAGYGGGGGQKKPRKTTKRTQPRKKGDIAELQRLLKMLIKDTKNHKKLKTVVGRVVGFMTHGVDVSALFPEMSMLSYTTNIITKKMIYMYLTNYSENNPDLAIMSIASFVRDIKQSKDYKIRGLALRSLCSLRFEGIIEYAQPHVLELLNDDDPYIKKAAINGCVKLYYVDKSFAEDNNIVNILYDMIKDPSQHVVVSAICALDDIMSDSGGIAINEQIVVYLINRLNDFDEFGKSVILDVIHKYEPQSEEEMYGIMNNIATLLKGSSSAVILGTIKIFLKFFEYQTAIIEQVLEKIRGPLLTLLSQGERESRYIIVCHIKNLINRGAGTFFEKEYKSFYCMADDPHYIQNVKLDILVELANQGNLVDILNELAEYVNDIDEFLSKKSIEVLGKLGCRFPAKNSFIIKQLASLIKIKKLHLMDSIAIAFSRILSKNSAKINEISAYIEDLLDFVKDIKSKISVVWMLGEFGNQIDSAPYLLEDIINSNFDPENESPEEENEVEKGGLVILKKPKQLVQEQKEQVKYKLSIITACIKLFTRRPAEMHPGLCALFKFIFENENEDMDILDRAGYYYNLMKEDYEKLKSLCDELRYANPEELDNKEADTQLSFNSMDVIFRRAEDTYVKSYEYLRKQRNKEDINFVEIEKKGKEIEEESNQEAAKVNGGEVDGAAGDDGDGEAEEDQKPAEPSILELVNLLDADFSIEAQVFQEKWGEIEQGEEANFEIESGKDVETLEGLMKKNNLHSIATGEQEGEIRLYLYARYRAVLLVMLELRYMIVDGSVFVTAKSENSEFAKKMIELVQTLLDSSS